MAAQRDPFKIEFSPLPIPTEPPDAPGGSYFYLSREWTAYARGMLSYLGMRRFWQDAPEQYDQILAWVYMLLDEISLPTDTIEVPIYIPYEAENDYSDEECEDCAMACNCGNSANVRYCEDTGWEYKGGDGVWRAVPGSAGVPSVDEQEELEGEETPQPTISQNACEKAYALWDTLVQYMDAIEETTPTFDFNPIPIQMEQRQMSAWWVAMMKLHKPHLPVQTFNALYGLVYWFAPPNHHVVMDLFHAQQDLIRDEIICYWQDFLTKENRLSDEELDAVRNYKPETGIQYLDDMLQQTLKRVISTDFLKQQAVNYIRAGVHTCACVGNAPTPPPPAVPEGYGTIAVELVKSWGNSENPVASSPANLRTHEPEHGEIAAGGVYKTTEYGAAGNQGLGVLVSVPDGYRITKIYYTLYWVGTGSHVGSGRKVQEGFYNASELNGGFATIAEAELPASQFAAPTVSSGALPASQFIYMSYTTLGTQPGDPSAFRIQNLAFDIKKADNTWEMLKVAPGVLFPL